MTAAAKARWLVRCREQVARELVMSEGGSFEVDADGFIVLGETPDGSHAPMMSRRWRRAEASRIRHLAHRREMARDAVVTAVQWAAVYAAMLIADAGLLGDAALLALSGSFCEHLTKRERLSWRETFDRVPKACPW